MKILLLLLASVSFAAAGTTLLWNASDTNAGPPAVTYKVYSSPVGQANWVLYATTIVTEQVITNNDYLMFRVTGVSAASVESAPSNMVTNHLAAPAPPGFLRATNTVEVGPGPNGPWLQITNIAVNIPLTDTNKFLRSHLVILR